MNNQHPNSTEENSPSKLGRREFLTASAGAIAAPLLAAGSNSLLAQSSDNGMIYRTLGRTGERVSVIGLGGWHIGQPSIYERESIQLIRQAIDRGITFMDNCWDYNEGASQVRMGKALKDGYREESVSVAFEEVTSQDWAEKVDTPDMKDTWDTRSKKPGYTMCMARRGGRHAASYGGDLVARADHHIMGSA
jgi:Aldo/keto reductase family